MGDARPIRTVPFCVTSVHWIKAPRSCSDEEFERLVMRRAQGAYLTTEENMSLGLRRCETPVGEPECRCGHYRLIYPWRVEGASSPERDDGIPPAPAHHHSA